MRPSSRHCGVSWARWVLYRGTRQLLRGVHPRKGGVQHEAGCVRVVGSSCAACMTRDTVVDVVMIR